MSLSQCLMPCSLDWVSSGYHWLAESRLVFAQAPQAAKPAYFFFPAFNFAHLALCAAAIFLRAAADMVRFT